MSIPDSVVGSFICPHQPVSLYACGRASYVKYGSQITCKYAHAESEKVFDGRKLSHVKDALKWASDPQSVVQRVDPTTVHYLISQGKAQLHPAICGPMMHFKCPGKVRRTPEGHNICLAFNKWHPGLEVLTILSRANVLSDEVHGPAYGAAAAAVVIPTIEERAIEGDEGEDCLEGTNSSTAGTEPVASSGTNQSDTVELESGGAVAGGATVAQQNCVTRMGRWMRDYYTQQPLHACSMILFLIAFILMVVIGAVVGTRYYRTR